jgi:hypothetical protein
MKEKRKSVRRFAAMDVTCYSPDGRSQIDKCILINISKGGIGIESTGRFSVGCRFIIVFSSPEGSKIQALAEILHLQSGSFSTFYGARYCEIDPSKILVLNGYLLKYFNLY